MQRIILLLLWTSTMVTTTVFGTPAPFEIRVPDFQTYDFNDGVPHAFTAQGASTLAVDHELFKGGGTSLKWTWTAPNATLVYQHPEAFKHLTGRDPDPIVYEWITFTALSTLSLWVYNETPVDDVLRFEIGDGKTSDCRFWMALNFKGWRQFKALYGRDIEPLGGFPNQQTADTLRILAPASLAQGVLRFDRFCPRCEQDVRFVRPTDEVPWVRPLDRKGTFVDPGRYVKGRQHDGLADHSRRLTFAAPQSLSARQKAMIRDLRDAYLGPGPAAPSRPRVRKKELAALRAKHAAHGFVRSANGVVNGTVGRPMNFWVEACQIADAWHRAATQHDGQAELRRWFSDYIDLCIQQGHGAGYSLRCAFVKPVRLMRDELVADGRWRPLLDRLRNIVGIRDFYNPRARANADVYNTLLRSRLQVIFLQADDRAVYGDLLALHHWLERTARWGEIKPDGSLFHHGQTYSGYNLPAIGPWVGALYLLRGTEFFAPTSYRYAYRTIYAMHWYSCITDIPHTLGGRWRGGGSFSWGLAQNCRKLAEMGTAESNREMAAIYLYYARHCGKTDEWTRRFSAQGIKPATTNGHLALNYTVAAIHRRDDWMVFFRGQRYPFRSTDIYAYQAGNTMGRYLNFGHMAIFSAGTPTSAAGSGWHPSKDSRDGWNFNFWPGTTTRELPFPALRAQFTVEEPLTAEPFAVGTHLDNNGVFGMKLREDILHDVDPTRIGPVRYWLGEAEYQRRVKASRVDPTFRARKSVFFFDNRILCLGSGIHAGDPDSRVVTTLFQHHLAAARKARFQMSGIAGGEPEKTTEGANVFPLVQRVSGVKPTWLLDSNGNGYVLPPGHPPLDVVRKHQKLPYHTHRHEFNKDLDQKVDANEGDTEYALLDHGPAPDDASYHYCILIRATAAELQQLCDKMRTPKNAPYSIIRQDNVAHIVYDRASATTAYVLFAAADLNADADRPSSLIRASKPCVAMLRAVAADRLHLSVCDPELGAEASDDGDPLQEPYADTELCLLLTGRWQLETANPQVTSITKTRGGTTITCRCRHLRPVVISLKATDSGSAK